MPAASEVPCKIGALDADSSAPSVAAPDASISIWRACNADLATHFSIRHRVFVNEQGVLVLTDIDRWDDHADVVHVLAARGRSCAGTVRLYPLDADGRWRGDRLAVLKPHRASLVGAQLVQFATVTAAARGGKIMEASIQLANVTFFERLGWFKAGAPYPYLGLPHQPMLFDLVRAPRLSWQGRPDLVVIDGQVDIGAEHLCPA